MAAELYTRVGAVIRAKREALGWSQAKLGERIGVGRTSITMIERGAQGLMVHQLVQLAAALRTNPSELLAEARHEPRLDLEPPTQMAAEMESLLRELERPVRNITRN